MQRASSHRLIPQNFKWWGERRESAGQKQTPHIPCVLNSLLDFLCQQPDLLLRGMLKKKINYWLCWTSGTDKKRMNNSAF